jgi:rhamnose transport system ATP-binding protein
VTPLLSLRGVSHAFGGVQAVRDVNLDLPPGEVCALLGENGAGKSTLMKAAAGALRPRSGTILLDGEPLPPGDPGEARARGIAFIYQELSLAPSLTVAENLFLGREPHRGPLVDRRREREEASRLLASLEARIDPGMPVDRLSVAEQQLVEIARALAGDVRVLIMDEPTSALSGVEAERLFRLVRRMTASGTTVVFITHRLAEVRALADRVVVLRDGAVVADGRVDDFSDDDWVRQMVGRSLDRLFSRQDRRPREVVLEVDRLELPPRVRDVSFRVRGGEIVALAGLVGAGRTDVGRALFGAAAATTGTVRLDGAPVRFRHPREAVAAGVGWVSEDRGREALIPPMSVLANLTLPHLGLMSRLGWVLPDAERRAGASQVQRLGIRTADVAQPVAELSGGNQQKVALARWWTGTAPPRLLICDEPTRGVDVGGRYEIYEVLEELARAGVAILMISSDLTEVLGMADRIVVMHEGHVSGEIAAADADPESVLRLAMGEAA